jgi:hypothetical protein
VKIPTLLILGVLAAAFPARVRAAVPRNTEVSILTSELALEKRLLARDLDGLARTSSLLARAADRVQRLSTDLRDSLRDDQNDPFSLDEKDANLREAESARSTIEEQFRSYRGRIIERRQRIALLQEELQKKKEESQKNGDILSGNWEVVSYPGPVKGVFNLDLDGTLVSGDYAFDGDWKGSLRGNLAGDRLRLERWDAEAGFSAVYYGRLSVGDKSIKGTWEATDLAGGKPTSGTWVARRRDEPAP